MGRQRTATRCRVTANELEDILPMTAEATVNGFPRTHTHCQVVRSMLAARPPQPRGS